MCKLIFNIVYKAIKKYLSSKKSISNNAKLILEEMPYEKIVCIKNNGTIIEARLTGAAPKNIAPHYVYELLRYGYIEQIDDSNSGINIIYKISEKGKQAL